MELKTASNSNEEQLYMLEFLIGHIDLTSDTKKLIGKSPICVRLKFIDFPIFELNQAEFAHVKKTTKTKDDKSKSGSVDFSIGKSCLFPKKPNDLVNAMRSESLQVGIFALTEKTPYGPEKEKSPICKTKVLLSGCLCDQVTMTMNDRNHLPKPYVLKNTYNLIDNQGGPSGTIALFLRLSCFGKLIVTQFALQDRSFLFKSSQSPNEFQCTKISTEPEMDQEGTCEPVSDQKIETRLKPQNVIGLSSICQDLAKRDGGPPGLFTLPAKITPIKEIKELFRKKSRTIDEEDSSCVCPDDGNYLKALSEIKSCGGVGCAGGLCLGTKLLDPLPRDHHRASPNSPFYARDYSKSFRMRGGGCCKDNDSSRSKKQSTGIMNFSSIKDLRNNQSIETLISGACKSAWKDTATPDRTRCGCYGKKGEGLDSGGTCFKKQCIGIDCLIRRFQETQDFVDSIGRVPGLAGLGLMDPSESPYFGREKETGNTCESRSKKTYQNQSSVTQNINQLPMQNSQSKEKKLLEIKSKHQVATPYVAAQTFSSVSNRPTRETPNIQNENSAHIFEKLKKKEDKLEKSVHDTPRSKQELQKIEIGPCGESKCKSKKKMGKEDLEDSTSTLKTSVMKNASNGGVSQKLSGSIYKGKNKDRHSKGRTLNTRAGSVREQITNNSFVKVSKNILKHIYSLGKLNAGVVYGHKNCLDLRMRVPKNMGWLWNTREVLGRKPPRLGWKPGAISRYVYELLQEAKASSGILVESRPSTPTIKGKKGKATKVRGFQFLGRLQRTEGEKNQEVELPPTLHIHRRDGTYYITMYPIKQESVDHPEIQEQVKPLQFKVTKYKDDVSICSSSTASDMEIEFSPPAAINRFRKKAEVKSIDVQVKQQDILDASKSSSDKPVKIKNKKVNK